MTAEGYSLQEVGMDEELLSFSGNSQEQACIGHLRGDFGCGTEFWTSWWGHNEELKSQEFTVYGIVAGNVLVTSKAVVLGDEKISHDGLDRLVVTERGRSIERSPDRDKLLSSAEYFAHDRPEQKRRRRPKEAER